MIVQCVLYCKVHFKQDEVTRRVSNDHNLGSKHR